jgi:hypothetical protein
VYITQQDAPHKDKIRKTVELKSNCEKSKSLVLTGECNKNFHIRKENVEEAEKFTYLGREITRDDGMERDGKTCIKNQN